MLIRVQKQPRPFFARGPEGGKAARATRAVGRFGVALAILAMSPPALAAGKCVSPAETVHVRARMLQTELMVAALSCNKSEAYNGFVTAFRPQLMKANDGLNGLFKARGGSNRMNQFITEIANQASQRSLANVPAFCQRADEMFKMLAATDNKGFHPALAGLELAPAPGLETCPQTAASPPAAKPPVKPAAKPAAVKKPAPKPPAAPKSPT